MRATSGFIRLFIRGLAWDSDESGQSFAESLKIAARARLVDTKRGKVLTGSGSGGTSVTFTLPPLGSLSADDVAEVCSNLLDRCDRIVAADSNITDAALVTALLSEVNPVRTVRPDFACGIRR